MKYNFELDLMNNPQQNISCNQCFGSVFIWSGSGSIQRFRQNTDPDPDQDPVRIRIQSRFKIAIFLSLGLNKGRPSYRRSLQPSKENIQHFKTWNCLIFFYFCESFLSSCIRIRIPNPDPDMDPLSWLNPDPIPNGSKTLPAIQI